MQTGLSDDLEHIDDATKISVIDGELHLLTISIAALQETRLVDFGSTVTERHYTIWQGLKDTDCY